jgi:N-acetylmuramoyl-L-alanine amidase
VGAVGLHGLEEKEITLDVAKRVRNVLSERYSIPVLLTRESDEFVPLARRTAYANGKKASAFVSIHVNASAAHDGSGLESYYLDNTNDAASRRLAERENGVAAGAGVDDVSFMLSDLIQSGKLEDSILLTRAIDGAMRAKVAPSYRQARFLGVKKGPFFVLVGAHAPCGLIELFFVDNPPDAAKLADDSFRQALAAGIAQGIAAYVRGELDGAVPARVMPVAARQPSGKARKGKRVYR